MEDYIGMENNFCLLSRHAVVYGLTNRNLSETLRGVGAIALGYPAREAGQPTARKQNYIVRI